MPRYELNIPGCKQVYLTLRSAMYLHRSSADFVGRADLPEDTMVQHADVVHPRVGIIRRYVYIVNTFTLRVRRPCLSGIWKSMDGYVSKALGNAPVYDYEIAGLGMFLISRKDH